MCAIITWCQEHGSGSVDADLLRALYRLAVPYGHHATGLVYKEGNDLRMFKRAVHPEYFIHNSGKRIARAVEADKGIGHVRWATHGAKNDQNAHPFIHYTADGLPIVYVHNGVISNYLSITPGVEVDSECLGVLIEGHDLARANGSVGAAWFEGPELYVYRHDQGLQAFTFYPKDKAPFTLVVSRTSMLETAQLNKIKHVEETALEQGHAYRVLPEGLEEAWKNDIKPPARSGHYRGGYCGPTQGKYAGG